MASPILSISRRTRATPFSRRVQAAGVKGYTVYNHMLLPTFFRTVEEDYFHLREAVQIWDVSCERQVEVQGPDAARILQLLTPRDLSKLSVGQCYYVPMVDETGGMLNDPVALKLSEDRFWISIADSDLLFWVKGLALGMKMNVTVTEPDVSPLGVQGPKAEDTLVGVFGEAVRDIRFFRFAPMMLDGQEYLVARSGYSKQGGFEIYLQDSAHGEALWDAVVEAGKPYDIHPGGPNLIERIEGGLLSYGNDMTRENTPFECGLGKFCKGVANIDCIGRDVLLKELEVGPSRQIRGLTIDDPDLPPTVAPWAISVDGMPAGQVTSSVWSPRLETQVSIAMVNKEFWDPGTVVTVETPNGQRPGQVAMLPF